MELKQFAEAKAGFHEVITLYGNWVWTFRSKWRSKRMAFRNCVLKTPIASLNKEATKEGTISARKLRACAQARGYDGSKLTAPFLATA